VDSFGFSVAVSGSNVVVGAPAGAVLPSYAVGTAYIYGV
jgi:hypothetical protein